MAKSFKHALVIGGSSGIGASLARCLAAQGASVALVARREQELEKVQRGIETAWGQGRARSYCHDVTKYEEVPALLDKITRDLGGLDLVVYAPGILLVGPEDEYDFAKDKQVIEVNLLGAMAWLGPVAKQFQSAGKGSIVGISSVAGDRGRRAYPNYHAAKAAFSTYLESLRNRLSRYGVQVTTIKPGPVATAMTAELGKQPFIRSADEVAEKILRAIAKGKMTAYVPGLWRPIMFVIRSMPSFIFRRTSI